MTDAVHILFHFNIVLQTQRDVLCQDAITLQGIKLEILFRFQEELDSGRRRCRLSYLGFQSSLSVPPAEKKHLAH